MGWVSERALGERTVTDELFWEVHSYFGGVLCQSMFSPMRFEFTASGKQGEAEGFPVLGPPSAGLALQHRCCNFNHIAPTNVSWSGGDRRRGGKRGRDKKGGHERGGTPDSPDHNTLRLLT